MEIRNHQRNTIFIDNEKLFYRMVIDENKNYKEVYDENKYYNKYDKEVYDEIKRRSFQRIKKEKSIRMVQKKTD